jgi:hypothetical protein
MPIDQKLILQLIAKFGKNSQLLMMLEEFLSLATELSKMARIGKGNKILIDKMAIAYIRLDELKIMYNIKDDDLRIAVDEYQRKLEASIPIK